MPSKLNGNQIFCPGNSAVWRWNTREQKGLWPWDCSCGGRVWVLWSLCFCWVELVGILSLKVCRGTQGHTEVCRGSPALSQTSHTLFLCSLGKQLCLSPAYCSLLLELFLPRGTQEQAFKACRFSHGGTGFAYPDSSSREFALCPNCAC